MSERINIFQRILERYKFQEPVSVDLQNYILASKNRVLTGALKSVGEYSFFYGVTLKVFFAAKRLGTSISVTQSAIISGIISIIITVSIIAGIALLITDNYREQIIIPQKNEIIKKESIDNRKNVWKEDKGKKPLMKDRLGIQPFANENVDSRTAGMVTDRIMSRLVSLKGERSVTGLAGNARSRAVNLVLTGSVGKLGSLYMISAKVINVENGRAIFVTTENVDSRDKIDDACVRIADQIADRY